MQETALIPRRFSGKGGVFLAATAFIDRLPLFRLFVFNRGAGFILIPCSTSFSQPKKTRNMLP
jgi:hypothetical protein